MSGLDGSLPTDPLLAGHVVLPPPGQAPQEQQEELSTAHPGLTDGLGVRQ